MKDHAITSIILFILVIALCFVTILGYNKIQAKPYKYNKEWNPPASGNPQVYEARGWTDEEINLVIDLLKKIEKNTRQ